ncbi:hypothetical protein MIMGU_mgv1a014392mg [Erythranthe guttata]|uniref:Uncharacterized protein n=1 Tax=Erythranthe guttata TaxID=4155 RepID=A0A022QY09_ERYGU|nr:hypothetical protein MIMGU_mgv1a014392mg [Erythranthe guttata]
MSNVIMTVSASETQNSTARDLNRHPALDSSLHSVHEHLQHPNPPHQLHPRLYLHRVRRRHAADGRSVIYAADRGSLRRRQGVLLQIELRGHFLPGAASDSPGGDEDGPDRFAGVDQLQRAVVVRELVAVRVRHGDVLEELEVDGAVCDGECRELDGVDGDYRRFGLEEEEVDGDCGDGDGEQEHGGHHARS